MGIDPIDLSYAVLQDFVVKKKLAFLHTLEPNVDVFENLLRNAGSDCEIIHKVDGSVLKDAAARGGIDEEIASRIRADISALVEEGANVVVCTCSSIGSVAETMNEISPIEIQRIDRAMADEAVQIGDRIVVAAAASSTLIPTRELLESSARRGNRAISIKEVVIAGVWGRYELGDLTGYIDGIAKGLASEFEAGDVIVLAQASMAEAAKIVSNCPIPILSSPQLGIDRALRTLG